MIRTLNQVKDSQNTMFFDFLEEIYKESEVPTQEDMNEMQEEFINREEK